MQTKARTFNYNFREQFAGKVEAGEKLQTVRLERRDRMRPSVGDRVQLFRGLRTASCRRIGVGKATECFGVFVELGEASAHTVMIDDKRLSPSEIEDFAKLDGFANAKDMREFFRGQYRHLAEFYGYCVRWSLEP